MWEKSMHTHADFTTNGTSTTRGGRWRRAVAVWRPLQPCHRQLCWHWCVKRRVARNRQGVARRWHRQQLLCHLFQNGIDTTLHGKETRPREQADILRSSNSTHHTTKEFLAAEREEKREMIGPSTAVIGDRTSIKRYLFNVHVPMTHTTSLNCVS